MERRRHLILIKESAAKGVLPLEEDKETWLHVQDNLKAHQIKVELLQKKTKN